MRTAWADIRDQSQWSDWPMSGRRPGFNSDLYPPLLLAVSDALCGVSLVELSS
jgi:hypothetical protein